MHTDSFYASLLPERALYADPVPANVDAVVLGAGLAGLSTAVALAEQGRSVLLCDSYRVGWGASGRNGGFVLPGFAESTQTLIRMLGADHGKALHRLSQEGCDWVAGRIAKSDRDDVIWGQGGLTLVRHPLSEADINGILAAEADLGDAVTFLDRDALCAYVRSDRYHAGFLTPNGIHINPLAYAELLAEQARAAGVLVREATEITNVQPFSGGVEVQAGALSVRTRDVVFC
ncbi:FAD-dependent oxidoreductase [Shimia sp. SDUM112013]|uniref:NAD(P)/FAD-dependent oxidoreductase n=1 Tax=Shimia sp. SDUM112013 TaxID=3136160 RepID=UPI0032F0474F